VPYRDKNKKIRAQHKYMSTLTGYLKELYSSAKRRNKKNANRRKKHHFDLEWIEFTNVFWNQVETLGGIYCAYTRQTMTHKRGIGRLGTNISLDRIDNTKGYTKDNIIFCTIAFNDLKGSVTIDACQKILDVYKERIGYVEEDDQL
jgi:hypothetical protein|tara:strand:- start:4532 stop:4969 length:438 start_codon:yes stop_codon:yes gene_type:complete